MSKINECSEEIKKAAFEKIASVKIYQLYLLLEVLNLASTRGTFKGSELSHVGALYDTLLSGVDKAVEISKEEHDKKTLPRIEEEKEHN